jgi:steroid 5-alpha reductase family enzyme
MIFLETYLNTFSFIMGLMTLLWLVSLAIKDASIVDIFWGTGFAIAGWAYFLQTDGLPARKWIVAILVTLWGLRLSIHIFRRNHGKPEDFRYQNWRREHGPRWWWWSFFQVFALQGIILWIVSAPVLAAQMSSTPLNLFDALGVIAWLVGIIFEAGGDWQLSRFKADPSNKGKLMTTGLWSLTRHPNYFGDAVVWWGHYLIGAAAGSWWTIFSPLLMTFLLMRVSGVAMLEKTMQSRPGYEAYMRNTPAFFPKIFNRNMS